MNTQKLTTAEFTRSQLAEMLLELSDDALEYVKLPLLCAYYWTDQRDGERLNQNDLDRFSLIGSAIHDPIDFVESTVKINRGMRRAAYEERRRT